MDRNRRAIIAGAGSILLAGLAGCSSGDGTADDGGTDANTEATETETPTETTTPSVETIVDEEIHLREDNYESWQFYVGGEFTLNYEFTVTEGTAIDVYVVEHRQLSPFQSQVAFETVAESENIKSDTLSTELPSGTYHLIVDHSVRGRAEPPGGLGSDPVDVQISATYQRLE